MKIEIFIWEIGICFEILFITEFLSGMKHVSRLVRIFHFQIFWDQHVARYQVNFKIGKDIL